MLDFDETMFTNANKKYAGTAITFYWKSEAKEKKDGGFDIEKVLYIEKNPLGDNKTVWRGKATDKDVAMFKKQHDLFMAGEEQKQEGVPLEEFPLVDNGMRDFLKSHKIHTIHALAALSEIACKGMAPGIVDLKYKAERYLDTKMDKFHQIRTENEELKKRLAALEEKAEAPKKEDK